MDCRIKILSLISICQKAGKLSSGELSCENSIRTNEAKLVIISCDASENTKKKFKNKCSYYKTRFLIFGEKNELGKAIGKQERSVISIDEEGFAQKIISLFEMNI